MSTDKGFNPYPGLRSFGPELADFFFGRERQIYQLLRILRKQRFIAVLGSSGSGKSSLVMAGLLPVLNNPDYVKSEKPWSYTIVQPENDPIGNLANSLNRDVLSGMDDEQREYTNSTLRLDINGIATTLKQAKFSGNLLIVIDQFEELFTHKEGVGSDREEVLMFNQLLLQAARQDEVQIYFVITMRSEYIGRCMELPGLVDLINKSQFLLPVMTRDDYREVIHNPAEKLNVSMNPFFVSSVLNDIEDREDQLPLLQHVLRRSWHLRTDEQKEAQDWPIDTYKGIGRLGAALNLHAQSLFDELPSEKHKNCCEIMFRRITRQTGKEDGVRVPKTFGHIASCVHLSPHSMIDSIEEARIILGEVFMTYANRDAGMLRMPDETRLKDGMPTDDAVVYIMHESLIRKWELLRTEWLPKETEKVTFYRQMEEAYEDFQEGKGTRLDGTLLGTAIAWKNTTFLNEAWVEAFSDNWNEVIAFIKESERRRRVAFLIRRGINIGMGVAIITLLGFTIWAYVAADDAKAEADRLANVAKQRSDEINSAYAEVDSMRDGTALLVSSLEARLDSARDAKRVSDSLTANALRARFHAEEAEKAAKKQTQMARDAKDAADDALEKAKISEANALDLAEEAQAKSKQALIALDTAFARLSRAQQSQTTADSLSNAADDILTDYNSLLEAKQNVAKANVLLNEYLVSHNNWDIKKRLAVLHAADSLAPGNSVIQNLTDELVFSNYFNPDKLTVSDLFIAGDGSSVLIKRGGDWLLYDPSKKSYSQVFPDEEDLGKIKDKSYIISSNGQFITYRSAGRTVAIIDLKSTDPKPFYWTTQDRKAGDIANLTIDQVVHFNARGTAAIIYMGDGQYKVTAPALQQSLGTFKVAMRKCENEPCELAVANDYAITVASATEGGECFDLRNSNEIELPDEKEVQSVISESRSTNKHTLIQIDYKTHLANSKLSTKALMNLVIYDLKVFSPSSYDAFIESILAQAQARGQIEQKGQKGN